MNKLQASKIRFILLIYHSGILRLPAKIFRNNNTRLEKEGTIAFYYVGLQLCSNRQVILLVTYQRTKKAKPVNAIFILYFTSSVLTIIPFPSNLSLLLYVSQMHLGPTFGLLILRKVIVCF